VKNNYYLYITMLVFASQLSFAQNITIDSLKRVLAVAKIDSSKVNLYNKIANEFKNIAPDSTAFYGQKAKILSQKTKYDFGQATALLNIGNSNIILSNYNQALKDFENAAKIFQKLIENDDDQNKSR
jgi:tetratricopeptide (TPR) repeat protein